MVIGKGYIDRILTDGEIYEVIRDATLHANLNGKKVLVLIPDHTRTAPIDKMFKYLYELIGNEVSSLDYLIALGTHPALSNEQIYKIVGITEVEHKTKYSKVKFFNHLWKSPQDLIKIGTITKEEISKLTDGLFSMPVDVEVNRIIFNYDHLLIVGPVFPHEVVGFSGGNKYIFPGISGQNIINFFHWLGAIITTPVIIGNKWTPVRHVLDHAVSFVKVKRSAFCLVTKDKDLAGIYYGSPEESWSYAVDLSNRLHIIYKEKSFHTVLACAPVMYDDIWTAGKCMYKLEPVVANGGTLIIYASHITEISYSHGKLLDEIGYHTRDYFIKQWDKFKNYPWGLLAHSTHVKGIGRYENGVEKPRINVVLATGISEERCKKVNLLYMNPENIKCEDYMNREDEGILYASKAGETLYRLKNNV